MPSPFPHCALFLELDVLTSASGWKVGIRYLGKPQGGQFISVDFWGTDCFSLSHWLWSLAQLALPQLAALSVGKAAAAPEPTERSRGAQPDSLC